jgi:hypothetical protein
MADDVALVRRHSWKRSIDLAQHEQRSGEDDQIDTIASQNHHGVPNHQTINRSCRSHPKAGRPGTILLIRAAGCDSMILEGDHGEEHRPADQGRHGQEGRGPHHRNL